MKIKRQSYIEEYNTTADWLKDFARKLQKTSYNIENLTNIRQMNETSKKYATIEEKMADIKARIGFDKIQEMHNDLEVKTAAKDCDCGCGTCDVKTATASQEYSEDDLKSMSNIIKYIQDMCKHEHEKLNTAIVISRCREEPGLRFDDLPINMEELTSFIKDILSKYNTEDAEVSYIPRDDSLGQLDSNPQAEYWSHAFPNRQ